MHTSMAAEQVYERILQRVDRAELVEQCRSVASREAKLIQRRVRGARRVLQHVYDVDAARRRIADATPAVPPATAALLEEIEKLHRRMARRMRKLATRVGDAPVVSVVEESAPVKEPMKPELLEVPVAGAFQPEQELSTLEPVHSVVADAPVKLTSKKRRLSHESVDSPRKPPRPGRLAPAVEDEWDVRGAPRGGPHVMDSDAEDDKEETEDEEPIELEVLDSDTEFHLAASLEKARRLRKISSERRMGELPGLIRSVLAEIERLQWDKLPRELLGILSATMGASTTLKPEQRREIHAELNDLRAIAMKIDEATARKYPTLNGSKARFLSSLVDLPPAQQPAEEPDHPTAECIEKPLPVASVYCENIEAMCIATDKLVARASTDEEPHSMEDIEELLTVVAHVFDNPTAARSDTYCGKMTTALHDLIAYVRAIPRNTRRRQQCEKDLLQYHALLTSGPR